MGLGRCRSPPRGGRVLAVGAYLFASAVLFGGAVVAAVHRVEFNDTGTSVVNGLHRYMTVPDAGGLRLALAAVIGFLVASAACAVLAVAAARNTSQGLRWVVLVATSVVIGLLVVLWLVAPPAFATRTGSAVPPIAFGVHTRRNPPDPSVSLFMEGPSALSAQPQ